MISFFKKNPKKFLGIDIGTSAIKMVELSGQGGKIKLENYGEVAATGLSEKPFRTFERSTLLLSNQEIAKAIGSVVAAAKIESKGAIFSIPDFSTFFTFLELPPMTKTEVPSAIQFAARQHIPLPLSEVVLDWLTIGGEPLNGKKLIPIKVMLVAVPHEVINQYQEIARLSQIQLISLEAEVFGMMRSLVRNQKGTIGLVDMGAQSTTISIVENNVLKATHSLDVSGNELTRMLSKSFNISYNEAEELKKKLGMATSDPQIKKILSVLIDLILTEAEKITKNFYQTEGKEIEKIVLAGGLALLPGLQEYSVNWLKKPVEIANPFAGFFFPEILEKTIKEMGPSYTIAVGMALKGFERN